jgi:hypothetical protein
MQPGWKKPVAIVLGVMLALLGLCFGAGALVVNRLDTALEGHWSTKPLSATLARDVFGIDRLPTEVLRTQSREGGFQDAIYDALLQIPMGSEAGFLDANGLERDENASMTGSFEEFEARIRELAHPNGAMHVTPLSGMRNAHLSDGGSIVEYRNASLLQFDDQLWVALEAFDT